MSLVNQKFGQLTVVALSHRAQVPGGTKLFWRCVCDCGAETVVAASNLKRGNTKSCGCLKKKAGDHTRTHGLSKTKAYQLWSAMIQRGRGNRAETYAKRGITVCERWQKFEFFLEDMGHPPGPRYSLERIDNDKGYEPANCKWLPMSEQWRNTSRVELIEFAGERLSIREIGERTGVKQPTLRHRLKVQKLPLAEAIKPK